ncbi:hypothetical protein Dsin_028899 [Dipteronia sinensis]|uniref:Acyl-CoA dehydrogenase/oxidase C-terminal domain-containing protein n=1 Tax=Dipteronia sinensis TaxID=43782 RepID=A0AAE0DUP5_9ROSI|nr:hypothetical protein Dsin_028899 [Dipteronia sinensis]
MQPIFSVLLKEKGIHILLMGTSGGLVEPTDLVLLVIHVVDVCDLNNMLGKTDYSAAKHKQQSMIFVDVRSPGVRIKRSLLVFGFDDAPHGHAEVSFKNVCVPASNILLGEGHGFEIAQGRLGPGRLHHCMRLIGAAEHGMQMMAHRELSRKVFGMFITEHGSFLADVAKVIAI